MKMRVLITAEYELTDNLAERQRIYGTTDPAECAQVDMSNPVEAWLDLANIIGYTITPVREALRAPEVRPGQVWADCDWRNEGRTIRVLAIEDDKAVCVVLTDPNPDLRPSGVRTTVGKETCIRLDRFKPNSTGWRLVSES